MREVISEKFNSIGRIQKGFEGRGKGEGERSNWIVKKEKKHGNKSHDRRREPAEAGQ